MPVSSFELSAGDVRAAGLSQLARQTTAITVGLVAKETRVMHTGNSAQ